MEETEQRSLQWEIENDWEISKLLVTRMNPKMFFYEIGKYGIYVQNLRPMPTVLEGGRNLPYHFGKSSLPHLVVVRSENKDDVLGFIAEHPEFECSRIFKSGIYFPSLNPRHIGGFCKTIVKNALYLVPNSALRFKSNRKDIRDRLYKDAVLINAQEGTGCTFDYDKYDYTIEVRVYKRDNGGYAVISILYGWDMPNHWHL